MPNCMWEFAQNCNQTLLDDWQLFAAMGTSLNIFLLSNLLQTVYVINKMVIILSLCITL